MCNAWRLQKLTLEKKVEQVTDDDVQTAIMAETAVTMDDPDATVQKATPPILPMLEKLTARSLTAEAAIPTIW